MAEEYEIALGKALEVFDTLSCYEVNDTKDIEGVTRAMRSAIMSKQYGYEDFLSELITKACVSIMSDKGVSFNVDNMGVCKSEVVQGMVFRKTVDS